VRGLKILTEILEEHYDKDHEVIIYQASSLPLCQPIIQRIALTKIDEAKIGAASTMYVPPMGLQNSDEDMIEQLAMVTIKIN
jgi:uroporphyrin-III C-methyltransferase